MKLPGSGSGGMPQNGTVASLTVTDHLAAKTATPADGPSGELRVYADASRGLLRGVVTSPGLPPVRLSRSPEQGNVYCVLPGSGTNTSGFGFMLAAVGTISHPAIAATSLLTELRRFNVISAGTSNSSVKVIPGGDLVYRGASANRGGFYVSIRFAAQTLSANARGFVGLAPNGAFQTTTTPSALVNCVGVMWDATETTLRIASNDGSGSCTRVDLGVGFPVSTSALYDLILSAAPNDSQISWLLIRRDTGTSIGGSLTTDLPVNTTTLSPQIAINNGGDAAAVAFDGYHIYAEALAF